MNLPVGCIYGLLNWDPMVWNIAFTNNGYDLCLVLLIIDVIDLFVKVYLQWIYLVAIDRKPHD